MGTVFQAHHQHMVRLFSFRKLKVNEDAGGRLWETRSVRSVFQGACGRVLCVHSSGSVHGLCVFSSAITDGEPAPRSHRNDRRTWPTAPDARRRAPQSTNRSHPAATLSFQLLVLVERNDQRRIRELLRTPTWQRGFGLIHRRAPTGSAKKAVFGDWHARPW